MSESKKIRTSMEPVDLKGPCGTCQTSCLENCAASLDSFSDITLEIDGESVPIKQGCLNYSNMEPLVIKAQTKVENFISARVPYLKVPLNYTQHTYDGYHTNSLKKLKYRYSEPCPLDQDPNPGGSFITDCVDVSGSDFRRAISDGGSSFPSIDYAKRRIFGDGSFSLESRTIVAYVDTYTIYFMCADDVDVVATDSYGNYEDWRAYEEYYMTPEDDRSGSAPSVSGGGLADFSSFLQASKDEVLDETPIPAQESIAGVGSTYDRVYKPDITLDTAPTEQSLKRNLRVISIKPKEDLLKSNRSLWKHGTSHGRFWADNFRKGYEDENYSDEDRPDIAHFTTGEQDCSVVVVKSTHTVTLGVVTEYMSPTGNRYCSFASKADFKYIDPSSGECAEYSVGQTLPRERWEETCEYSVDVSREVAVADDYCPDTVNEKKIYTIKGLPITIDQVVEKIEQEFTDHVAGNQVLDMATVDLQNVQQSYDPNPSWIVRDAFVPLGYAKTRILPARNKLDSIQRLYSQGYRKIGADTISGGGGKDMVEITPVIKGFSLSYSESLKADQSESRTWTQGAIPSEFHHTSVSDRTMAGWKNTSWIYLTEAHWELSGWYTPADQYSSSLFFGNISNNNYEYAGSAAEAGVIPKSYQIELFLSSGCNVSNTEVYHVSFKPSDLAPESNKTLNLDKKYSTEWTKHNSGTCIAQPKTALGDAEFDSFSTQEDAYISWSSFCGEVFLLDTDGNPLTPHLQYIPSPYLNAFDGDITRIISTATSTSINMFCASDSKYWQDCHHREYTTNTIEMKPSGYIVITPEVFPEWKSIAYTGFVSAGFASFMPQGDLSETTEKGPLPPGCVATAGGYLVCEPYNHYQTNTWHGGPYRHDEDRVNNDTIIDYMHVAYRNKEPKPSETWDEFFDHSDGILRGMNQSFPSADSPFFRGDTSSGQDRSDKDIRYIQLRKKDGNKYGVSSFDASYSFSDLYGDYTVPDCGGFSDGSTKWPEHDSCPWWMYFSKSSYGTATLGGMCNNEAKVGRGSIYGCGPSGSYLYTVANWQNRQLSYTEGSLKICCCVEGLDSCPDTETNADHTAPFDSGYKWWWLFNINGCNDLDLGIVNNGRATKSFGCRKYGVVDEFCDVVNIDPGVEASTPFYGQRTWSWSAPSCSMIEYVNATTVEVQPITIKVLEGNTTSSSLSLTLNKEGI
jgi:hypothetical protein